MYALPHIYRMSNTESLLRKNLEWLIAKRKTNPHELQRVTGVPQPTIHRILTGESTDPRTKTLQPLAEFFGVSVSELRDRELSSAQSDGKPQHFDENVKPAPQGTRPIPVISAVQAGALRDMESPYEPGDGYAIEYTDDMGLSRWTFALDIEGQSMMPEFRPGDRVIVDPEVSPNPGDFVVARNGSNQATFKKYRPRGIDQQGNMVFELVPLNDDYPTMRSDIEHLIVLGVLMEHRKKYRRT